MGKLYHVKEPANDYAIINHLYTDPFMLAPFQWIKESKIIQSLAMSTDVYIASSMGKIGKKAEWSLQKDIGAFNYVISAKFLDPYDSFQSVSELQVWSSGPSADVGVSNIKRDLNSLPEYDHLLHSYYYKNLMCKIIYPLYNPNLIQYRILQNQITKPISRNGRETIDREPISQIGQLTRNVVRPNIFMEKTKVRQ